MSFRNYRLIALLASALFFSACGEDNGELGTDNNVDIGRNDADSDGGNAGEGNQNDENNDSNGSTTSDPATNNGERGAADDMSGDPEADEHASASTDSEDNAPSGGSSDIDSEDTMEAETSYRTCRFQCSQDSDCQISNEDLGYVCMSGHCIQPCNEDAECLAAISGWLAVPCTSQADCPAGPCVAIGGGAGGCALAPIPAFSCSAIGLAEVTTQDLDGNPVTACGLDTYTCTDPGLGVKTCTPPDSLFETSCQDGTLLCPKPLSCGEDGLCHCTSAADCTSTDRGNTCTEKGLCIHSCDSDPDCANEFRPFDGGSVACR